MRKIDVALQVLSLARPCWADAAAPAAALTPTTATASTPACVFMTPTGTFDLATLGDVLAAGNVGSLARCVCSEGHAGAACSERPRFRALSASSSSPAPAILPKDFLAAGLLFAVFVCLLGRFFNSAPLLSDSSPLRLFAATVILVVTLFFFVHESSGSTQAFSVLSSRALIRTANSRVADMTDLINSAAVNYDDYKRAVGPAPFPTRAFMITTKTGQENGRTAHAVEQVRRHLNITDIHFVYGRNELRQEDFGCDTRLATSSNEPVLCRMGLGWATHQIWIAIAASGAPALFLEDDVLFHDDTATLLPLYWKQVPPAYEIVYLGSAPRWLLVDGPSTPPAEPVKFGLTPLALTSLHSADCSVSSTLCCALHANVSFAWMDGDPRPSRTYPSLHQRRYIFGYLWVSHCT